jgi:hypothetical protein
MEYFTNNVETYNTRSFLGGWLFVRHIYELPEPYTAADYNAALEDFVRRYKAGERTE